MNSATSPFSRLGTPPPPNQTLGGLKILQHLLSKRDLKGKTAILEACEAGELENVKVLREFGSQLTKDSDGRGIVHIAIVNRRWEIVSALLAEYDLQTSSNGTNTDALNWHLRDDDGRSAWDLALADHQSFVQALSENALFLLGTKVGIKNPREAYHKFLHPPPPPSHILRNGARRISSSKILDQSVIQGSGKQGLEKQMIAEDSHEKNDEVYEKHEQESANKTEDALNNLEDEINNQKNFEKSLNVQQNEEQSLTGWFSKLFYK
eukprot:GDKJ01017701.1.p1 GENE.GDKJ01017701.1~~GDKJ01017701.1.p1  ORF type:complete len:275 (-),score=74.79 GDKJ01017701.1:56-850(-)